MTSFEYLSVLISIIVGLGLSHLLRGAARLIQRRDEIRVDGLTLVWMGLLFVLQIQIWWAAFDWQSPSGWDFFPFLLFLTLPIGAYLLSVLVVPDLDRLEAPDEQWSFLKNRMWFFGLLTCLPLLSLAHERVQGGGLTWDADVGFRLAFVGLAFAGFLLKSRTAHQIVAIGFSLTLIGYVALLFQTLG